MNDPEGFYAMITWFGLLAAALAVYQIVRRQWRELELTFWGVVLFGGPLLSIPLMESLPDGDYVTHLIKAGLFLALFPVGFIALARVWAYNDYMGYDGDY